MEKVANLETLTTTQASSQQTSIPDAEPVPDWQEAKKLWGIAWNIHWIGLGAMFSVLAIASVAALVRSGKRKGFGRKPFVITINSLLLVLAVTRALYLFVDPYESRQNGLKIPRWLAHLLYNIAFPCLTSAFGLIFLIFLRVAKLQLAPKRLQKAGFLIGIISLHFTIVLVAEIIGVIKPDTAIPAIIVCQVFFIIWGLLLSVSFIYAGLKVVHQSRIIKKHLRTQQKTNTSKVAKVTLVTSCLGLACSILQLYSLISVYGFYRDNEQPPSAWKWWAFHTSFRLVEMAMACTIAYCVMQPADR